MQKNRRGSAVDPVNTHLNDKKTEQQPFLRAGEKLKIPPGSATPEMPA